LEEKQKTLETLKEQRNKIKDSYDKDSNFFGLFESTYTVSRADERAAK
jgi:hypothetical protein